MNAVEVSRKEVKMGQLLNVINQKKRSTEKSYYYPLWVEDLDSSNERCILFTDLRMLERVVDLNSLPMNLKPGRLYPVTINNQETYLVKVTDLYDNEKIIRLAPTVLEKAEYRAKMNLEDLPQRSWLNDIID